MSDLRADTPAGSRDLAIVVRFVDGFTRQPVRSPLSVSISKFTGIDPSALTSLPSRGWTALWSDADLTYRFSLPNLPMAGGTPPALAGTFDLLVTTAAGVNVYSNPPSALPNGPYAALTPLQVTIPPSAAHPPPVLSSDYLVELPLWPTVAFTVPDGETAISGWVVSAGVTNVAGLKLAFASSTGPKGKPWARTDGAGQFLYRLPNLPRPAGPDPQAALSVEMVDQTNAPLTVAPATLKVSIGKSNGLTRLLVP